MTDGTWIWIAVVGGVAVIRELRTLAARRRARRALLGHPELSTELVEGTVVRVTGHVRELGGALVSPIAGRRCVAYRSRGAGRVKDAIGLVRRERAALVPFEIERDGGSRVRVESTHALLDLPKVRWRDRPRDAERQFSRALGFTTSYGGRFEEVVVEPGQRISVVGLLMLASPAAQTDEELGFRDTGPPALRVLGNAEHPIALGVPV